MDNTEFLNKKTDSSVQSLHLHQEIIEEEILPRLPVKSLLKFRCVSKSWRSMIGSKRFIKTHLKNSTNNQNYAQWKVIFNSREHGMIQCSMRSYLDEEGLNLSPIDNPPDDCLMITTDLVVGCCNGLVCVVNADEFCFFVLNAATRISIELPETDLIHHLQFTKLGFGWEEESGAYKVFVGVFYEDDDERLGKVYSSETNSWKTVEHGSLDWHCSLGKFARGRLHWVAVNGGHTYIESFDLKREVFETMELPCKLPKGDGICPWLWVIEGCLSVVCDDYGKGKRRVWIMKEYGVKESWVEEISKPSKKIRRCCEAFFYPESLVSPIPQENL
ncbi:F-box/kelch-repeat protein At3g23880-like [Salvia miltiorrhiza]|uniref:F-box/kelch-repeat protein At3g23880-like n=1 Tax=Salvia miltiorrhiza TaxID=226208 RepID=UPI0025ACE49A|nr:F-box/kelch-repeat protein At3g23880-like [Salvia miltiorrhiza]